MIHMLFLSDISFTFCKALIFLSPVWTFGHECHIVKALINYSISPSIHVYVLLFINQPATSMNCIVTLYGLRVKEATCKTF